MTAPLAVIGILLAGAKSTETEHTPIRSQGQYLICRFKHHSTATTSIGYRTGTGCASTSMCHARRFRLRSATGTLAASRLTGPELFIDQISTEAEVVNEQPKRLPVHSMAY